MHPGTIPLSILTHHVLCRAQERDLGDEYGWKQVHGDVFRPATSPILFSALIGTGYQIAFVATCTITIAILGELYTKSVSPRLFF
jgi:hypothetical protein